MNIKDLEQILIRASREMVDVCLEVTKSVINDVLQFSIPFTLAGRPFANIEPSKDEQALIWIKYTETEAMLKYIKDNYNDSLVNKKDSTAKIINLRFWRCK